MVKSGCIFGILGPMARSNGAACPCEKCRGERRSQGRLVFDAGGSIPTTRVPDRPSAADRMPPVHQARGAVDRKAAAANDSLEKPLDIGRPRRDAWREVGTARCLRSKRSLTKIHLVRGEHGYRNNNRIFQSPARSFRLSIPRNHHQLRAGTVGRGSSPLFRASQHQPLKRLRPPPNCGGFSHHEVNCRSIGILDARRRSTLFRPVADAPADRAPHRGPPDAALSPVRCQRT